MRRFSALHKNFDETKKLIVKALCKKLIKEAQSSIGLVYRELSPDSNGMVSAGELMAQPWEFVCFLEKEFDEFSNEQDMRHVVIGKNKYNLIDHSSDPREPSRLNFFTNAIDLACHCASMQVNAAARIALLKDPTYIALEGVKTYESLEAKTYLVMQYQDITKEKLGGFLKSKKARAINWFINFLA